MHTCLHTHMVVTGMFGKEECVCVRACVYVCVGEGEREKEKGGIRSVTV